MFSCLQILEAFLWFVLITLLNVTLIILTLSVSRLLNLLLRLVAFLLFLNPQCLASISRWITASSSWKRMCVFVRMALISLRVICMFTAFFFSRRSRHTRCSRDWSSDVCSSDLSPIPRLAILLDHLRVRLHILWCRDPVRIESVGEGSLGAVGADELSCPAEGDSVQGSWLWRRDRKSVV